MICLYHSVIWPDSRVVECMSLMSLLMLRCSLHACSPRPSLLLILQMDWQGTPIRVYAASACQSGAWALKKSLMRPSFFLYFREIRKKQSHWPGGQSAPRLYNRYNLCPCARPAHVGECGPGPEFKFSKTVEVSWSCKALQRCQREIATDEIQEEKYRESAAM